MKLSAAVWKALVLGVLVGLVGAVSPACSPPKKPLTCNASNCPGCCDGNQMCFTGLSEAACGTMGATCMACGSGQTCVAVTTGDAGAQGGRCLTGGMGGGSSGGGSAGGSTAGGAAAGGNTGGAGGGSTANCNAQNCPGCCTSTGCQNPATTARCGMGGATCAGCMPGKTCVNGTCTTCAGCVDLQSGRCETGMTDTSCGKNGEFCANCSVNSATCTNQACVGNMGGCNPNNCAGCCDGQTCVLPASQSGMQCGQGQAGSLCVSCNGGTCDTSDAGLCMGGAGGGTAGGGAGGGLPGLDGGFPTSCDGVTSLCGSTECCVASFGLCVPVGTSALGIIACGINGGVCNSCIFQTCNMSTGMCQ